MNEKALGFIETVGMAPAIEAADAALKSADVNLIGYELTRGFGLVTVKIEGDVSGVKMALSAAKESASKVGKVYSVLVIARPCKDTRKIIDDNKIYKNDKNMGNGKNQSDSHKERKKDNNTIKEDSLKKIEDDVEENIQEDLEEDLDKNMTNELDIFTGKENLENEDIKYTDYNVDEKVEKDIDKTIEQDVDKDVEQESIDLEENENIHEDMDEDTYKDEEIDLDEDTYEDMEVCNICHDPSCPRRKGQSKRLCIHNN